MQVLDLSQPLGVECDLGYNLQPIIHTFYASSLLSLILFVPNIP